MDMTLTNEMSCDQATNVSRPAGLVSVDGRTYPLRSVRLEGRAEGGVAATKLIQEYSNPYEEPLEVLYTLPLPASGAVIAYAIRLGDRIIRGEVRRREEAQAEYRRALFEGRTAALLEQDRADTFTQRLGCLTPGATAAIEIDVLQPLAFLPADKTGTARWEYRFPTVVGVRYEGTPGRVPDAGKLDVDRAAGAGTPVRIEASLIIADGPAGRLDPSASNLETRCEDVEGGVRIALREGVKLDRDLVFRWTADQPQIGVRAAEGGGLPCDDGRYALITITPPAKTPTGLSRDLTLLIDASGSMTGKPLACAKIVVEELLRSLDPGDRFEILAFADRVQPLVSGPKNAGEKNLQSALQALARLKADGSTEMAQAIVAALTPLRSDAQRQVILISDGYIGFESEVIGEVLRRLSAGARVHAVGIGAAPNRSLTRGIARAGRGVEILVGDDDDARAASQRLLQATVRPMLTDLTITGSACRGVAPERPQDVLAGQPIVLLAEIAGEGGTLEIRGRQAGDPAEWIHRLEFQANSADRHSSSTRITSLPLGALFAHEAIEDVELRLAAADDRYQAGKWEEEIERLGLRHGIASRKTSLVAISEDPAVDPKDPRRCERLTVELPADVSAEGVGLASPPRMAFSPMGFVQERAMPLATPAMSFMERGDEACDVDLHYSYAPQEEFEPEFRRVERQLGFEIFEVRVLALEGPLLVLEFEVPSRGFLLPPDGFPVQVWFGDGRYAEAIVLGEETSARGPHHPGLTIRLGVRLSESQAWGGDEMRIGWYAPETGDVQLHLSLGS
jgi:Ca-activated chloride channel family protein